MSFAAVEAAGAGMATGSDWARWPEQPAVGDWSVGAEEEVMLLSPGSWQLAQASDEVLPALSRELAPSASRTPNSCAR